MGKFDVPDRFHPGVNPIARPVSRFDVPDYFVPGVKDPNMPLGQIPGVPIFGEALGDKVIPENEWLDAINAEHAVKLSESVWTVLNQGSVGSCASEGITGGCILVRALSGRKNVLCNPYGIYGRVNGGSDSGSSLQDNIAFVRKYGCFPESVWPRSKGWRAQPTEAAYEAASHYKLDESYDINNSSASQFYAEFFSALMLGFPVYFGYPGHAILACDVVEESKAPPEAIECANIIDAWIRSTGYKYKEPCPTGLVDTLYIKYLNSWGNWGDNGFGYLRANRIERYYGAYALRTMIEADRDQT